MEKTMPESYTMEKAMPENPMMEKTMLERAVFLLTKQASIPSCCVVRSLLVYKNQFALT